MKVLRIAAAWLLLCGQALAAPPAGPSAPGIPASTLGAPGGPVQADLNGHVPPSALTFGTASNKGFSMQLLGDSRGQNGSFYCPTDATTPGILKGLQSPMAWAEIYSDGKLSWDPATGPYNPAAACGAIIDFKILNGGLGYTAPTLSVPVAVGFTATLGVTNGVITSVTITNFGAKPTADVLKGMNWTITDATGSGAVITPVLNGSATYSVAGSQLDELNIRLGDIISQKYAPKPHFLIVIGGTNGFASVQAGTTTLRAQLALAMQIIQRATAAGMHVVWLDENPKSWAAYGTQSTATTQTALINDAWVRAMHAMASLDTTLNPAQIPFDLVDESPYQVDTSLPNGANRTLMTLDGLHWTPWGAEQEGLGIEQALRPYYQVAVSPSYSSLGYDPTYNPMGNLISPLYGTNGVLPTGITGAAPGGWTMFLTNGSGTGTVASAITAPTSAAPNADGTVVPEWTWNLNLNGNGAVSGVIEAVTNASIASNLSAGDNIKFSCEVSATGMRNITGISVALQDGASIVDRYQIQAPGTLATSRPGYMAPAYDSQVGSIPPTGAIVPSRFTVSYTATAQTIATNNVKAQLLLYFDADATPSTTAIGVAIGAAAQVTWRNCQTTKTSTALLR